MIAVVAVQDTNKLLSYKNFPARLVISISDNYSELLAISDTHIRKRENVDKQLQDLIRISSALAELVESPMISVSTYRDVVALQKRLENEIAELRRKMQNADSVELIRRKATAD